MFDGEAFLPSGTFRAALVSGLLRQHQAVSSVGALGQGLFAAGLQFFQSVLANGLQHCESRFTLRRLNLLRQAFIHHGGHAIEQVQA